MRYIPDEGGKLGDPNERGLVVKDTAGQLIGPYSSVEGSNESFAIKIDSSLIPNLSSEEGRRNQQLMYHMRSMFLADPHLKDFYRLPQALEAYARAQDSTFTGTFGAITGIVVNKSNKQIAVLGDQKQSIIDLNTLDRFAIEKKLDTYFQQNNLLSIPYSEEMNKAIDYLDDVGKYFWSLVSKAGLLIAKDPETAKKLHLRNDITAVSGFGIIPDGVGVFVDDGQDHHNKFTVAKVTNDFIPWTEEEKHLLNIIESSISDGFIKEVYDHMLRLQFDAEKKTTNPRTLHSKNKSIFGEDSEGKKPGILSSAKHFVNSFTKDFQISKQYLTLMKEYREMKKEKTGFIEEDYKYNEDGEKKFFEKEKTRFGIGSDFQLALLESKHRYTDEKPFEYKISEEDIPEWKSSEDFRKRKAAKMLEIIEFIKKHKDVLKKNIEDDGSEHSKRKFNFLDNSQNLLGE